MKLTYVHRAKLCIDALTKMLSDRTSRPGFERLLFQQLKVLSGGNGECCCEIKVNPDMLNINGTLHGGVTASLVDAVSTYALTTTGTGRPGTSIDLSVSYLKAVNADDTVIVTAKTLSCGKTIAVCAVEVSNKATGQLVAHGKHSKFVGEIRKKSDP